MRCPPQGLAPRWLIRDHAITVLPSAASLVALRRTGRPSAAAKPMLGFANPLLDGNQGDPKFGAWYREEAPARPRADDTLPYSSIQAVTNFLRASQGSGIVLLRTQAVP
jgi:hypothetical protein